MNAMNSADRTQQTYDEVAGLYLERNRDRTEVVPSIDRFSRLLPARACVLDVGSGPGVDSNELTRRGFRVISSDLSFGMLEAGRRSFPGLSVQADMLQLPFARSIQGCWVNASLHHVDRALVPKALSEFRRVLMEPGILHIEVKQGEDEGWETERYGPDHPRWYAYWQPEDLDRLLNDAGFEVLDGQVRPGMLAQWISRVCRVRPG
jgi:SAM-dependent methyltransferase